MGMTNFAKYVTYEMKMAFFSNEKSTKIKYNLIILLLHIERWKGFSFELKNTYFVYFLILDVFIITKYKHTNKIFKYQGLYIWIFI